MSFLFGSPSLPKQAGPGPTPAEPSDESVRKAKLMERRRQLGLSGDQSTWLTGARGDTNEPDTTRKTLLGV